MLNVILYDCDTCKRYPCVFINDGEPKELKGNCMGYKVDLIKLTKELTEIENK